MPSPKIVAIVQARMSSHRLPGKVLRALEGRAIIGHVIDRLRRCRELDGIWIATSSGTEDDGVSAFARAENVPVHRASLDDVAARLLAAAKAASADALVRISGDSPLIDPAVVDRAVALYRKDAPDLASNVVRRTFPKGQSVEVISVAALERAIGQMTKAEEHEHVTPWFYAHPQSVRIASFESIEPRPDLQLSVDTQADFVRIGEILRRLGPPASAHGLDAILTAADVVAPVT